MDANKTPNKTDLELITMAMENLANGSFNNIDTSQFQEPSVAEAFNKMLDSIMERNNRFLARINDAMTRVSDLSSLKEMLTNIDNQQEHINIMEIAHSNVADSRSSAKHSSLEALALSRQLRSRYRTEDGQLVIDEDLFKRIMSMTNSIADTYKLLEMQTQYSDQFMEHAGHIIQSFDSITASAYETGRHLHRISRDIDNARNDQYRQNSKPTLHDTLNVFEVDHNTLSWRMYNHLAGIEELKLKQVNNTNGCKFGLWFNSQTNPLITESDAFKRCIETHATLHAHCTACFNAKAATNLVLAYQEFDMVLESMENFRLALADLHEHLNQNGITGETEIWKYEGFTAIGR